MIVLVVSHMVWMVGNGVLGGHRHSNSVTQTIVVGKGHWLEIVRSRW